jgi:hypothetical protein
MKDTVIIAPHCDDEIIGAWEIIKNAPSNVFIIYDPSNEESRKQDALKLKSEFPQIKAQLFLNEIPPNLLNRNNTFYFPDPINEIHPLHRKRGFQGEQLLRENKLDVIFYSIIMNVPWMHECEDPTAKKKLLNKIYSSERSLWDCDAKYYLFEARYKWIS